MAKRRPEATLSLSPSPVVTGQRLRAEVVLTYQEPTQVDEIDIALTGKVSVLVTDAITGDQEFGDRFFAREWKSARGAVRTPAKEHSASASFEIPISAPPSYQSAHSSVVYNLHARVRQHLNNETFRFNKSCHVVLPSALPPTAHPVLMTTSRHGPIGETPFMELALDSSDVALGDVLSGSISVQNLRGRRVRGVDVTLFETEVVTSLGTQLTLPSRRFRTRVFEGTPKEGEAIRFKIAIGHDASPTFRAGPLFVESSVEARMDVVWGDDIVVGTRVFVAAEASERRRGKSQRTGTARQIKQWERVARESNFAFDPAEMKLHARRGSVTIEIGSVTRDTGPWTYAKLLWPKLGIDLDVHEKQFFDAIARLAHVIKTGDAAIDDRLVVLARDRKQVKSQIAPPLLRAALFFDEVRIYDGGADLASKGLPVEVELLVRFVAPAVLTAHAFDELASGISPPSIFTAEDAASWQALATGLHGRLERGRMWIHGARMGIDTIEIGCTWTSAGLYAGAIVHVAIDPILDRVPPTTHDDPSISPLARAAWKELTTHGTVTITPHAITINIHQKNPLTNPHTAMPILDLAVQLRRALAGVKSAGPFR